MHLALGSRPCTRPSQQPKLGAIASNGIHESDTVDGQEEIKEGLSGCKSGL
jgi:hypothetical protein